MSAPDPTHPLAHVPRGRHGAASGTPLHISFPSREIVQVMVRRGRDAAFATAMRDNFGMDPPAPGHAASGSATTAIWTQPGHWLLVAPGVGTLADRAATAFAGLAAVVDQSHGRTTIRLSGAAAREAQARGCRLDLHPRAFGPRRTATTIIAQTNCLLHQTDAAPTFELTIFSTLAAPFLDWLLGATAPYWADIT